MFSLAHERFDKISILGWQIERLFGISEIESEARFASAWRAELLARKAWSMPATALPISCLRKSPLLCTHPGTAARRRFCAGARGLDGRGPFALVGDLALVWEGGVCYPRFWSDMEVETLVAWWILGAHGVALVLLWAGALLAGFAIFPRLRLRTRFAGLRLIGVVYQAVPLCLFPCARGLDRVAGNSQIGRTIATAVTSSPGSSAKCDVARGREDVVRLCRTA